MIKVYEYRTRCPYVNKGIECGEEMEYLGAETTCMGILCGTNDNEMNEIFMCKQCERTFVRSWKWKELKEQKN